MRNLRWLQRDIADMTQYFRDTSGKVKMIRFLEL